MAAPPSASHFANPSTLGGLVLSPSGKRLAMLVTTKSGRVSAAVLDLPLTDAPARSVAAFEDADVQNLAWVNDDRLVLTAFQEGVRIRTDGAGTLAVDHDGRNLQPLMAWRDTNWTTGTRIHTKLLPYGWFLRGTIDDGSADVLVQEHIVDNVGDWVDTRIARLNTQTGALANIGFGVPGGAVSWVFDAKHELRVVRTRRDGRDRLLLRPTGTDRWEVLQDVGLFSGQILHPLFLEGEHQLIVATNAGRDTLGYYSYDLRTRKLDPEPIVHIDRYDAGGPVLDHASRQLVGAHLVTERPTSAWFTTRLATIQKTVDAALPAGRFNRIGCGRCEASRFYVIRSSSDRQPGEYFLYDHERRSLARIGSARPWIVEAEQGKRSFHWVAARDGLQFPVIVTHPAGRSESEALPAVMLVHGGPHVRGGDRSWQAEAQFLASRGWRVIQPEFRGSLGFGGRLFEAGWKQWGLAMQDDLDDALAWAAKQGLIDPKRVCIYGGSYGGYAALMGPIRHPGRYRCAASHVGVTDIDLMFSSGRSDLSVESKRYSLNQLIGDPKADAERLRATSPIRRVAEIKVPVLLAHGTLDRRVPREHANAFEAAARAAGVDVERVNYNDEAHGWSDPKNHADFLERLERFLARHLAAP